MKDKERSLFRFVLGILIFASLVFSVSLVASSPHDPVITIFNVSVHSNQTLLNVSLNTAWNNTNASQGIDVQVFAINSSTANNTWSLIMNWTADPNTNYTGAPTWGKKNTTISNATLIPAGMLEDGTYTFIVVVTNKSDNASMGTNTITTRGDGQTPIIIDTTVPTAPSSLTPTSDADGAVTFSGTVTGSQVTKCDLEFQGTSFGSKIQTMTHSGNTCSLSLTNVPEQTYTWLVRASDGRNNTVSATQQTTIDIQSGGGVGGTSGGTSGGVGGTSGGSDGQISKTIIIIGLVILIVIVVIATK